jgi:hypothetical protein
MRCLLLQVGIIDADVITIEMFILLSSDGMGEAFPW